MANSSNRIVVLVDMDCFFCQVETKLQPQHAGKPLAVVQYNQWEMGGIIAVNYEARNFGVTRHMRGKEAKEKCPDIVLVSVPCLRGKADTTKYRKAGREVIEVIRKHCNTIERASVDEAYLDITDIVDKRLVTIKVSPEELISSLANTYIVGYSEVGKNKEEERQLGLKTWIHDSFHELQDIQAQKFVIAGAIVEEIRASVYKETGFRCSAGIAQNKILAKLACGLHKPNCQTILPEAAITNLYSTLPVKKVRNLGGKFGDIVVESLGCNVMGDLLQYSLEQLQKHFDEKTGLWLYNIARGIDNEPVTNRLLVKSIGACKKFPGKQAITSLEVLKHWAEDLAAEVCERLEQDLIENQRRATLLTISYHYYQNRNTVSQSRSLTLNSYKPEKMASQCVDVITKSTQYPVAYISICASKFVPSKESGTFLKFFKTIKSKDNDIDIPETLNSSKNIDSKSNFNVAEEKLPDVMTNNGQFLEAKKKKSFAINKEDPLLRSEEKQQSCAVVSSKEGPLQDNECVIIEESIAANSKVAVKNKRIADNLLNTNAEDSPTSRRLFKLMQVCTERDNIKRKDKRMSNMPMNNHDFQNSFFMNVYKTDEKNCSNINESMNIAKTETVERSTTSSAKKSDINNEDIDACDTNLRGNAHEEPSASHAYNNAEDSLIKEENHARNPSVRLQEIFPDMNNIDPEILLMLPSDLQEEAKRYARSRNQKRDNTKTARDLPKTARGKSGKSKANGKEKKHSPLLYDFLIKTDANDYDVSLKRCAECDQMIPAARFSEHADFHVAQNLYQELNKPTSNEKDTKRKFENAEVITSAKRHSPSNSMKILD